MFQATTLDFHDRRTIALNYRLNPRTPPRILHLISNQRPRPDDTRPLPFAYQYLEPVPELPHGKIIVVAAPGVALLPISMLRPHPLGDHHEPIVHVYRVQDPALVPRLGSDLSAIHLIGSHEVNAPPEDSGLPAWWPFRSHFPPHYFKVERFSDGVTLSHPRTGVELHVRVPTHSGDRGERRDARARFAYWLDPEAVWGDRARPLVTILKTPAVRVTRSRSRLIDTIRTLAGLGVAGERFDWERFTDYYQVFDVDRLDQVPVQGEPLERTSSWRPFIEFEEEPPLHEAVAQAGFDTGIGLIPGVGDVVDVGELLHGIETGRDRWGNRLGAMDFILMGIGSVIPFVGGSALRHAAGLVRRFGPRAGQAQAFAEALRRAGLTAEDGRAIEDIRRRLRAGETLSRGMLEPFADLLRRLHGEPPTVRLFINEPTGGFLHAELQEGYRRYAHGRRRAGARVSSPLEWARNQPPNSQYRRLLMTLCGPEYAARGGGPRPRRFVNVPDIPRPGDLTDARVQELLDFVDRHPERVVERLGNLFRRPDPADAVAVSMAGRRVDAGHLSILKGNIGEILSYRIQRQVLAQIATKYPDARLLSGLRMRVMEGTRLSGTRLFSDNIIAVKRRGQLWVLGVFEVKSGSAGGAAGTEQIFRWIERDLEEHSQLILPRGTRVLAADGTESLSAAEQVFVYHPGLDTTGRVMLLATAQRHLIAPQGRSLLGLDSAMQVAADVARHELPTTSAEIDYLCARIIDRWSEAIRAQAELPPAFRPMLETTAD